ncbi:ParB N-terminal domain-containing protein [Pendulispora rubella]|uniref:ParB N-terminal domain-containing protein n=2 Tax=Pendulispora rubella TaxID=2741070 RepID=A0ABZ2LDD4_9BACT
MGALHSELGIKPEWWWEATTNTAMPTGGSNDRFAIPAHPAAKLFPMATDAELHELASDIRANGLRQPVVLIKEGGQLALLDGRNRMLACELAGIAPTYLIWQGLDPIAYVVSANLKRRQLTPNQRASLATQIAELYEEAAKRRSEPRPDQNNTSRIRGHGQITRFAKSSTNELLVAPAPSTSLVHSTARDSVSTEHTVASHGEDAMPREVSDGT